MKKINEQERPKMKKKHGGQGPASKSLGEPNGREKRGFDPWETLIK